MPNEVRFHSPDRVHLRYPLVLSSICTLRLALIFSLSRSLPYIVYNAIGVTVFSLFLVYDTQVILGGKHRLAFHPEDYLFAALSLYQDVIGMFLHILSLFGGRGDS